MAGSIGSGAHRPAPEGMAELRRVRLGSGAQPEDDDVVAVEEPLEIRLGVPDATGIVSPTSISVTMRTPGHDFDLVVGFLLTEGIIHHPSEILRIDHASPFDTRVPDNAVQADLVAGHSVDFSRLQRHFYTSSSCGVCGKTSIDAVRIQLPEHAPVPADLPRVSWETVRRLPEALRSAQGLFERTGGVHATALFDAGGRLLLMREDVGRHNAMDKVIGAVARAGTLPLSNHLMLVSGRASFELVQKAAMAGVPVLCSVGAPSSLAVELAEETGITLIGFLRAQGANLYSGRQRLLPPGAR